MKDLDFCPTADIPLAKHMQNEYNSFDGADLVRCVGGCFTCAGTKELPLFSTAVVLFSDSIISCTRTYVHSQFLQMYARVYVHIAQIFQKSYRGDIMGISDARKKANDKWREKFDEVRFRVPKGQKDLIQAHAEKVGDASVNAFLVRAVKETIERDKNKK